MAARSACSLTVLQALGEGVRQLRRADRRGGARDVVLGAPPLRPPPVRVEQQPRGARVAVARLADASGVAQPLAAGQVERLTGATRVAGRRLALGTDERQRDVRVADEAHPL